MCLYWTLVVAQKNAAALLATTSLTGKRINLHCFCRFAFVAVKLVLSLSFFGMSGSLFPVKCHASKTVTGMAVWQVKSVLVWLSSSVAVW